jgi:3-dehydroquinate synthetase
MILALRISFIKKICNLKTVNEIEQIYKSNGLNYTYKKYSNQNIINSLIPHLKNDKKNNDNKINFILLKKIGLTTLPNKYKISLNNLKRLTKFIAQC